MAQFEAGVSRYPDAREATLEWPTRDQSIVGTRMLWQLHCPDAIDVETRGEREAASIL